MSAVTALLCSTLLFVGLFVFVSADQKNITAESGQNVTLKCRAPKSNIRVIEWSRADLGDKYVLLHRDGHFDPANQHPSFKNRVDLQDKNMKDGDVSLILNSVTVNDTGTYECHILTEETHSQKSISIIYLTVNPPGQRGGHTEAGGKEEGVSRRRYGLIASFLLLSVFIAAFFVVAKLQKKNIIQGSSF
ncbi:unnamed protein product [Oreochromis niloticus]|nr:unnamed protein product [Mustela putorius furo]